MLQLARYAPTQEEKTFLAQCGVPECHGVLATLRAHPQADGTHYTNVELDAAFVQYAPGHWGRGKRQALRRPRRIGPSSGVRYYQKDGETWVDSDVTYVAGKSMRGELYSMPLSYSGEAADRKYWLIWENDLPYVLDEKAECMASVPHRMEGRSSRRLIIRCPDCSSESLYRLADFEEVLHLHHDVQIAS